MSHENEQMASCQNHPQISFDLYLVRLMLISYLIQHMTVTFVYERESICMCVFALQHLKDNMNFLATNTLNSITAKACGLGEEKR